MILNKLISGNVPNKRKTRFHNERGNIISLVRFPNLFRSIKSKLQKSITSNPPFYPWLPYSATRFIRDYFKTFKNKNILEFGSGCSTIFFHKNNANIYSKEDNYNWFKFIERILNNKNNTNLHLEFAEDKSDYLSINKNWPDKFDLILIDGSWRDDCLRKVFERISKNCLIILDNSDKFALNDYYKYRSIDSTGDVYKARNELLEFASSKNFPVKIFTDFAPCNLSVHECLIVVCE